MKKTDIKIVGAVSDESTLEEIENIAKVFAYEQRMKDFTAPLQKKHLLKKAIICEKKIGEINRIIQGAQTHILVKGLW